MSLRRRLRLLVAVPLLAAACASGVPGPLPPGPPDRAEAEYRIQTGDRLLVQLFYDQQLSQEVLVRPDGRISLQLIDEVEAAGTTPAELAALLQERYAEVVELPRVAVSLLEGAQRVYILGEVRRPGEVPWSRALTALQASARVGGFTHRANMKQILVIRRSENGRYATRLDLVAALDDPSKDLELRPDDTLYVPLSPIARVNKWVDQWIRQNIPIPLRAVLWD